MKPNNVYRLKETLDDYRERNADDNSTRFTDRAPDSVASISWAEPEKLGRNLLPIPDYQSDLLPRVLTDFVTDVAVRRNYSQPSVAVPLLCLISTIGRDRVKIAPRRADPTIRIGCNLSGVSIATAMRHRGPSISELISIIQGDDLTAGNNVTNSLFDFSIDRSSMIRHGRISHTTRSAKSNLEIMYQAVDDDSTDDEPSAPIQYNMYANLLETDCAGLIGNTSTDHLMLDFPISVFADSQGWALSNRKPDYEAIKKIRDLLKNLESVVKACVDNNLTIRFSQGAQEIHDEWLNGHMFSTATAYGDPLLDFMALYKDISSSVVLNLHLIECAECDLGPFFAKEITLQTVKRALKLCDYFIGNVPRIYSIAGTPAISGGQEILDGLRSGKVKEIFSPEDIAKKSWRHLKKAKDREASLQLLVDHNYLQLFIFSSGPKGGRPGYRYYANPAIFTNKA